MKIPKKLKIGGHIWKVEFNKDTAIEGNCFGSNHTITQKIFIDPQNTEQKAEQTLLHEILHALWFQAGIRHTNEEVKKSEEFIVDTLSQGLYQVLKDNKLLKN